MGVTLILMNKNLKKRIEELVKEDVDIVSYNKNWPKIYIKEKNHLMRILPPSIVKRIEHFGSTSIVNIPSKPVIDILVEVTSLVKTKKRIVPIMENLGYEYFWRPTIGNEPPFYAWFIKRDRRGQRTHHIHMVESDSKLWDRLLFRDYLNEFPKKAKQYGELKISLSKKYPNDRVAYTKGKTEFIQKTTKEAKKYYSMRH